MRKIDVWKCFICGLTFKTKSIAELHERITKHKPNMVVETIW